MGRKKASFTVMEEELGARRPKIFGHLLVKPIIPPNCLPARCLGVRRLNLTAANSMCGRPTYAPPHPSSTPPKFEYRTP